MLWIVCQFFFFFFESTSKKQQCFLQQHLPKNTCTIRSWKTTNLNLAHAKGLAPFASQAICMCMCVSFLRCWTRLSIRLAPTNASVTHVAENFPLIYWCLVSIQFLRHLIAWRACCSWKLWACFYVAFVVGHFPDFPGIVGHFPTLGWNKQNRKNQDVWDKCLQFMKVAPWIFWGFFSFSSLRIRQKQLFSIPFKLSSRCITTRKLWGQREPVPSSTAQRPFTSRQMQKSTPSPWRFVTTVAMHCFLRIRVTYWEVSISSPVPFPFTQDTKVKCCVENVTQFSWTYEKEAGLYFFDQSKGPVHTGCKSRVACNAVWTLQMAKMCFIFGMQHLRAAPLPGARCHAAWTLIYALVLLPSGWFHYQDIYDWAPDLEQRGRQRRLHVRCACWRQLRHQRNVHTSH